MISQMSFDTFTNLKDIMKNNITGNVTCSTICANFTNCKTFIDVSHLPKLSYANIAHLPITEVTLCEVCSKKKMEEKRKNNPTLFKEIS